MGATADRETLLVLKDEALRVIAGADRLAFRNMYLTYGALASNKAFLSGYIASIDTLLAMMESTLGLQDLVREKEFLQDRVNMSKHGDHYTPQMYKAFASRLWCINSLIEEYRHKE